MSLKVLILLVFSSLHSQTLTILLFASSAKKGGVCIRHGAKCAKRKCTKEGCTKYAQKGGLCIAHGAKVVPKKRCSVEGCGKQAQAKGMCHRHRVMKEKEEEGVKVAAVAASGKGSGLKEG